MHENGCEKISTPSELLSTDLPLDPEIVANEKNFEIPHCYSEPISSPGFRPLSDCEGTWVCLRYLHTRTRSDRQDTLLCIGMMCPINLNLVEMRRFCAEPCVSGLADRKGPSHTQFSDDISREDINGFCRHIGSWQLSDVFAVPKNGTSRGQNFCRVGYLSASSVCNVQLSLSCDP